MAPFLAALAGATARHWKRSLLIAFAVLIALGGLVGTMGGSFVDEFTTPNTDSQRALDLLEARYPAQAGDVATLVFAVDSGTLTSPKRARAIAATVAAVARQPHVTGALNPLQTPGQLSPNKRVAYATVQFDQDSFSLGTEADERLEQASAIAERSGIETSRNGFVVEQAQDSKVPIGELIGIAAAILVLTIAFRSIVAMTITLVAALISLATGLMLLTLASAATTIPTVAPTLGAMLGLGAGIDYALLLVGRYREQLAAGDDPIQAAKTANATAGASVVAAGLIVVIAIAGLLTSGLPYIGAMGIGAAIVVATVAVGAVTLLPPLAAATARRLTPKRIEDIAPSRRFEAWSDKVTRHPVRFAAIGVILCGLFAAPALDMRLGQPDDSNASAGSPMKVSYERLSAGFGPGFTSPLVLAVDLTDAKPNAIETVTRAIRATPGVARTTPAQFNPQRDAAVVNVIATTRPQDEKTNELLGRIRDDVLPAAEAKTGAAAYVGGRTAIFADQAQRVTDRLPIFIAAVVGLSLILLTAAFRSIWVPIVSALFNLLAIFAAYGVVVAVFQWGWGAELIGATAGAPLVSFIPMFMFAILFGLSMDYNVFLLSRVHEEYLGGADARTSVRVGLARVARTINAAGAIMIAVFLGFSADPELIVKTFGIGLAAAVLFDVTVIRMLLAPAVLTLLGDRAWWLPGWLDRILPHIALEGDAAAGRR